MHYAYGKSIHVNSVDGSTIGFEILDDPEVENIVFYASFDNYTEIAPGAPHTVEAIKEDEGLLYLMKMYLTAQEIPIRAKDPKFQFDKDPLELSLSFEGDSAR